jgi:hypothetical protein
MEHVNAILLFVNAMQAVAVIAVWISPEALRWGIKRFSMRVSYMEAGQDAAEIERKRFEVVA